MTIDGQQQQQQQHQQQQQKHETRSSADGSMECVIPCGKFYKGFTL